MARVKDLWFTTAKDAEGRQVKVPTARHPRYLAEWTGPDRKPDTKAFAKKGDAERHATAMEVDDGSR
ncbi:hypothetical protein AB0M95_02025 [Sphaerisporangium sp. NPDC051017]|uniref:hypothetical protein n=1 Tax=Sphaerisporangium sp. NPDC051017 TaxID=3154636 RepID=UPI0034124B0E